MHKISYSDCIRCSFNNNLKDESEDVSVIVEVYFAETEGLASWYPYIKNFVSDNEQIIAGNFNSDTYRMTYLTCHALLRLMLAKKLNKNPFDLPFSKGFNNKPFLLKNQAYFNISHTNEAFAIAIVMDFQVGIDLERINQGIKYKLITDNNFNNKERKYILDSKSESIERFFLLWTRK
jgi:phosphopantetheinyl transferase